MTATESLDGPTYTDDESRCGAHRPRLPGLLALWTPDALAADRVTLDRKIIIGRSTKCAWRIRDRRLSRMHLSVTASVDEARDVAEHSEEATRFVIEDLNSRNGVVVDGQRLTAPEHVGPNSIIRAGGCVFLTTADLAVISPPGEQVWELSGRFHASTLRKALSIAARTGRHLLLEGASGTGKELAARQLHEILRELEGRDPLVTMNAACYGGEDDAVGGIFGVVEGAFTGVAARTGAITAARGGTLFIDEAHALPLRAQRSLLRFVEGGTLSPLGQPHDVRMSEVDVRLLLGTNVDVEAACREGTLADDLVARFHRLALPTLNERRADVPSIFIALLERTLEQPERIVEVITARHIEQLCLHDYSKRNVRELVDLVALLNAHLEEGSSAVDALESALEHCLGVTTHCAGPGERHTSSYEKHRRSIIEVFEREGGNLSRTEAVLRKMGLSCSRRWLAIYLERWGVRRRKRKS